MSKHLRNQLLRLLLEQQSPYISGEEISKQLGCSRAAIWKHVQELRNQGYEIEARSRNGYRLISKPDRIAPEEINFYLQTEVLGKEIRYYPAITSTQESAHQWALAGAKEGSLVIADQQTTGRGRLGTSWVSPAGTGIWMSLILRPNALLKFASHFTLLAAVSVFEAIQSLSSYPIHIKWPNDLLINKKKVCGILTELKGEQDRVDYMVIGIGLNVKQNDQLPSHATSLEEAAGKQYIRAQVIAQILQRIELCYMEYVKEGFAPIRKRWEAGAQSFFGREVQAKTWNGVIKGIAEGLNDDGALIIRSEGEKRIIYSADIQMT
ncbi:BirA family transcriptional regulator, biotin operon repressor / biotin-[acetyl-CoA-carboxylase] ligase [Seinonella peptonophila]|uniref:Bifunctional ligase/repressor BirA n=1 Tax=Seinonella peptonophila TaxID=112248 RepID=A0A1M4SVC7_9BACL|nr:biotin--[acetyl-CoA-carboxylase] ligase [Seinonella peptonophila]SHE35967.1 BirA family transcriptional regulator, biotin operon repressor / biotin-[acetyl-CoA-carboxylase] ligase [Seinonella peptonophila]